jgi:saccharopine dehydrogenase-like NADP-dependent oxidoreductase
MNEIGLDPGIDHVSATALLTQIREAKKRVVSFTSFCGGLPAPDSLAGEGTGLGYKFSWSPRGVLGAALNGARFKLAGKVCIISLFCSSAGYRQSWVLIQNVGLGHSWERYTQVSFPSRADQWTGAGFEFGGYC